MVGIDWRKVDVEYGDLCVQVNLGPCRGCKDAFGKGWGGSWKMMVCLGDGGGGGGGGGQGG